MIAILTGVRWYFTIMICISILISYIEYLLMCLLVICLLWKKVYLSLLPIFWYGVVWGCWYILEIYPMSVTLLENFFPHSVGFLFILFMVSFAVPKLPSLIRSHWLIFAFISSVLGDGPKKTLLQFKSEYFAYILLGVLWCHVLYLSL